MQMVVRVKLIIINQSRGDPSPTSDARIHDESALDFRLPSFEPLNDDQKSINCNHMKIIRLNVGSKVGWFSFMLI